jgi:hypothetical protein
LLASCTLTPYSLTPYLLTQCPLNPYMLTQCHSHSLLLFPRPPFQCLWTILIYSVAFCFCKDMDTRFGKILFHFIFIFLE